MGLIGKITRRTFLVGSAAIAGGVAFGYYKYLEPYPNALLKNLKNGEAALNSFVKITLDDITLITPRTDLGQGAYSIQAALIAEELDVELDQVKLDPGLPDPAYYNTALSEEGAPFRSTDQSFMANSARGVMDMLIKFMGMQVTGGSTTVPDGYEKLRYAGAVARETLKAAASKKTGIDRKSLKTSKGHVVLPDGNKLSYNELASIAAEVDPVTNVSLRDAGKWRLLGKPMQRHDIVAKSTGTQTYGIDLKIEGMLYATIKLNPRQGGEMKSYNAGKAENMRGVKKVIPIKGGVGVIADNTWRAFQAANSIEFDWGPAPYPAEMEGHWGELSKSFTDERLEARFRDDGDTSTALGGAKAIEAEYRLPYLAHAPLEPISAIVKVTQNRVDVWTGTQIPAFVQNNVSKITGVPSEQVYVHVQMIGAVLVTGSKMRLSSRPQNWR